MVNSFFEAISKFLMRIVLTISSVFLTPVYLLVKAIAPDITNFLDAANLFFNNYILSGLAFVKEVIFNITGFPRVLVSALVTFYVAKYTFKVLRRPILFLYRMFMKIGLLRS